MLSGKRSNISFKFYFCYIEKIILRKYNKKLRNYIHKIRIGKIIIFLLPINDKSQPYIYGMHNYYQYEEREDISLIVKVSFDVKTHEV